MSDIRQMNYVAQKAAWDPANIATDGANTSTTVTMKGVNPGDVVYVTHDKVAVAGALIQGVVTSKDTVTVTLQNETGGALDVASGTLTLIALKTNGLYDLL